MAPCSSASPIAAGNAARRVPRSDWNPPTPRRTAPWPARSATFVVGVRASTWARYSDTVSQGQGSPGPPKMLP